MKSHASSLVFYFYTKIGNSKRGQIFRKFGVWSTSTHVFNFKRNWVCFWGVKFLNDCSRLWWICLGLCRTFLCLHYKIDLCSKWCGQIKKHCKKAFPMFSPFHSAYHLEWHHSHWIFDKKYTNWGSLSFSFWSLEMSSNQYGDLLCHELQ